MADSLMQRVHQTINIAHTHRVEINFDRTFAHRRAAKDFGATEKQENRLLTLKRKVFHV